MSDTVNRKNKYLKYIKKLRYFDDRFMKICIKDRPDIVKLILRITAGVHIREFKSLLFQDHIDNLKGHSIIIDIHAVDEDNKEIAVEIQSDSRGADVKRARYISSLLDAQTLPKNENYSDIPDNYVIFITEYDVLKAGQALYKIENCVDINGERQPVRDGKYIIYVNGAYRGNDEIGIKMYPIRWTRQEKGIA